MSCKSSLLDSVLGSSIISCSAITIVAFSLFPFSHVHRDRRIDSSLKPRRYPSPELKMASRLLRHANTVQAVCFLPETVKTSSAAAHGIGEDKTDHYNSCESDKFKSSDEDLANDGNRIEEANKVACDNGEKSASLGQELSQTAKDENQSSGMRGTKNVELAENSAKMLGSNEIWSVVTGDAKGCLRVWDLHTRRVKKIRESAHTGEFGILNVVSFEQDGKDFVVSQGRDGTVRCWLAPELELAWSTETNSFGFCKISLNLTLFASPFGEDGELGLWSLQDGSPVQTIVTIDLLDHYLDHGAQPKDVTQRDASLGICMAIELKDDVLFVLFESASLGVFDLRAGMWSIDVSLHGLTENVPIAMTMVPMSEQKSHRFLGAAVGADPELTPFYIDMEKRKSKKLKVSAPLRPSTSLASSRAGASDLVASMELDLVAVACWDGTIRVFKWSTLAPDRVFRQHKGAVHSVCMSKTGRLLAAAGEDGNVSIHIL